MIIEINNPEETQKLAQQIALRVDAGDVIALYGDLGMGKSFFSRCFIRALTHEDEEVPSPTFTLLQTYEADSFDIYHFDMYRLDTPDDCLELGVEEAFQDGVCLIEWPDKIGNYLPWDCLKLEIKAVAHHEMGRQIILDGPQKWQEKLKGLSL